MSKPVALLLSVSNARLEFPLPAAFGFTGVWYVMRRYRLFASLAIYGRTIWGDAASKSYERRKELGAVLLPGKLKELGHSAFHERLNVRDAHA